MLERGIYLPPSGYEAAFVSIALFSSVLAYIFWNRGVEQVGASVAGLFVHLMPLFGVLLAWLFLDERLGPYHIVGIGLILSGIYITSRFRPAGERDPLQTTGNN